MLATLAVFVVSAALRWRELDTMVNIDMYERWQHRIAEFMTGVLSGRFRETYQTHHPGVTFMWLAGLAWHARGVVEVPLDAEKLRLAVLPIACIGTLFPVASFLALQRLFGDGQRLLSLLAATMLATEPLLVAHSLQAHLDMLVTSFSWLALLLGVIAHRESSMRWAIGSGVLLGLALLSKLTAAGQALGIAAVFVAGAFWSSAGYRRELRLLSVVALVSLLTVVALWPVLWVAPDMALERLMRGGLREIHKVGPAMFFGKIGRFELPFWAYGVFLVFLATPEFFLPAMFAAFLRPQDPRLRRVALLLALGTLPLALAILHSRHSGPRYLVPVLPFLGTVSALVLAEVTRRAATLVPHVRFRGAALMLCAALVTTRSARVAALAPLPIAYCSRWTRTDCHDVFHLGFGEGLKEAALLVERDRRDRGHEGKIVVFGSGFAAMMSLWAPIKISKRIQDTSLLVDYLPDWQRRAKTSTEIAKHVKKRKLRPLYEVTLAGRTYVRIYAGPRY